MVDREVPVIRGSRVKSRGGSEWVVTQVERDRVRVRSLTDGTPAWILVEEIDRSYTVCRPGLEGLVLRDGWWVREEEGA